jgi:DNA-binding NarL/FixJ family response regulator
LSAQPDLTVVAEADDYQSVPALTERYAPDVILFRLTGPCSPLPVLRELHEFQAAVHVILVGADEDAGLLSQAVRLGIAGILSRKSPADSLLDSIRKLGSGGVRLDHAKIAELLHASKQPLTRGHSRVDPTGKPIALSRRESEIVSLVTQGYRNVEVAEKLSVSEQTVKNHMHNIFRKLGIRDRLELALFAIHRGLNDRPSTPEIEVMRGLIPHCPNAGTELK